MADAAGNDITAGTGGIGTLINPLRTNVTTLVTDTNAASDADQFLFAVSSVDVGAADLDAGTVTIRLAGGAFYTTATGSILSNTVVASGATLGGEGTVTGSVNVNNGGTVSPGNLSTDILNTGSLTLVVGADFDAEVNGNVAGTSYDQLNVSGAVNLDGAMLNTSGTVPSVPNQTIVLINNNGSDPVVGTFAGLAEGDTVFINSIGFKLSYAVTGSATFVTDYTQQLAGTFNGSTGTVTFGFGQLAALVFLDPKQDQVLESDETVTLTLLPGSNYVPALPNTATANIIDDDINVSLAAAPATVLEDGGTSIDYTFTRTGVLTNPLTVSFSINGTAMFGRDYSQSGAASFAGNVGTVTFAASAATVEADETVFLGLTAGAGYNVVSPINATGTILNDDVIPVPSVSVAVSPSSVLENGAPNLIYTFTRRFASADPQTVNFTVSGTATFITDYTQGGATTFAGAGSGSVTFGFGQLTASVIVNPKGDTAIEGNETVILTLASGTGYTTSGPAASGEITDDDFAPTVTLAVAPASVMENGSPNMTYTFTRTGSTANALTVNFTVGGSATFVSDYTQTGAGTFSGAAGSVAFGFGQSTAKVIVNPKSDSLVEVHETVSLTLTASANYAVGTVPVVTGTITNDDVAVRVAVSPGSVTEDGLTNLVYTLHPRGSVDQSLDGEVRREWHRHVWLRLHAGGGRLIRRRCQYGGDPGFGQTTAQITLDPHSDNTVLEGTENVLLTIIGGLGYTIGDSSFASGSILDI